MNTSEENVGAARFERLRAAVMNSSEAIDTELRRIATTECCSVQTCLLNHRPFDLLIRAIVSEKKDVAIYLLESVESGMSYCKENELVKDATTVRFQTERNSRRQRMIEKMEATGKPELMETAASFRRIMHRERDDSSQPSKPAVRNRVFYLSWLASLELCAKVCILSSNSNNGFALLSRVLSTMLHLVKTPAKHGYMSSDQQMMVLGRLLTTEALR